MDKASKESGSLHARVELTYAAVVCGDGRVMPIAESIGRRCLREIDPDSREGRELLQEGLVTLWYDDGRKIGKVPLSELLAEMEADLRARQRRHGEVPRWRRHHAEMARSVSKSKKALTG